MIKELKIYNFRCIKNLNIVFDNKMNLIYGKNAQGKTSIIEAVYFLATGKSFRTKKIKEMIALDENNAIIFSINEKNDKIAVELKDDKKKFLVNGEKIKYIKHIGKIFAVSFIPEDIELIIGKPNIRREFFNYEIGQVDNIYLENIMKFEKILKIRNEYIKNKQKDKNLINVYEELFIKLNVEIILKRYEYIRLLNEKIEKKYIELFNNSILNIKYKTFVEVENKTKEEIEKDIREIIKLKRNKEYELGFSLVGIQKDDFEIYLDDKIAKSYTSQGEKKSIVFTIKVSEIEMFSKSDITPIFLMDDINSYFDENRKNKIIKYLKDRNIQCFITSTENQNIEGKIIYVDKGSVYHE